MIHIPVSIGELFDKISILEIKVNQSIDAAQDELDLLNKEKPEHVPIYVQGLYKALYAINLQLWDIEDRKREMEQQQDFKLEFIEYARAVYILNDERARLKGLINKFMGSSIREHKSHREY